MALPLMILTKYHLMFVNELLPTVKLAKMIPKCWYKVVQEELYHALLMYLSLLLLDNLYSTGISTYNQRDMYIVQCM